MSCLQRCDGLLVDEAKCLAIAASSAIELRHNAMLATQPVYYILTFDFSPATIGSKIERAFDGLVTSFLCKFMQTTLTENHHLSTQAVGFLPNLSLNFGFFSSPPSEGRGLIVPVLVAVAVPLLLLNAPTLAPVESAEVTSGLAKKSPLLPPRACEPPAADGAGLGHLLGLSLAVGFRDVAADPGADAPDTVRDGVCTCIFPRLRLGLFSTFGVAALCLRLRVIFIEPPGVDTGSGGGDMAVVGTFRGFGAGGASSLSNRCFSCFCVLIWSLAAFESGPLSRTVSFLLLELHFTFAKMLRGVEARQAETHNETIRCIIDQGCNIQERHHFRAALSAPKAISGGLFPAMSSGNGWTAKGSSCSRTRPPVSIGFGAGFSASSFFKAIANLVGIAGFHLRHRG
ncbi:hypothetical protein KCU68_g89, partial [Aureobasidium melanogenum]